VSASRQVGRLFSTATNSNFPIPALPQIIIGRRDPDKGIYPDVDLSAQGSTSNSVSRQHARLLLQGNQVFVEDLNSTNSTYLNRQKLQPGQRYLLNSGDELRLGGVVLIFYIA
jgi:pSer/pThr/pTyr-binding forkhead associated (FHA) protein